MLSPFLVPPTGKSHNPSPLPLFPQSTVSHFPVLVFPYTVASSHFRTKGFSSL